MRQTALKAAFILAVVFLAYFAMKAAFRPLLALADVQQLTADTDFTHSTFQEHRQLLGTGLTGTINEIKIRFTGTMSVNMVESATYEASKTDSLSSNWLRSYNLTGNGSSTDYVWDLNGGATFTCFGGGIGGANPCTSGVQLESDKYYALIFHRNDETGKTIHGASTDTAYRTAEYNWYDTERQTTTSTMRDAYFQLNGSASDITPDSIEFTYPTPTASTTEPFNWGISYTLGLSALNPGFLIVNYGYTSSSLPFEDGAQIDVGTDGTFSAEVLKGYQLLNPPLLNGATFYAQAKLYAFGDSLLATSSVMAFQVYYENFGNASSTPPEAQCSLDNGTTLGAIRQGLCESFAYLFYNASSTRGALNKFGTLKDGLAAKPPFGYFEAIKTGLSGLATSTPSSTIVSASTTSAFSLIFSPIRSGFSMLIYLLGGFYLYRRFSHLEL